MNTTNFKSPALAGWIPLLQQVDAWWDDLPGSLAGVRAIDFMPTERQLGALLERVVFALPRVETSQAELPYGRYLVHHDLERGYNLQLDIFSSPYVGKPHAHRTWGLFAVLQGALQVTDWLAEGEKPVRPLRENWMVPGAGQAFGTQEADWHEVRVPAFPGMLQPISIHLYGKNFDLDQGLYLNDQGQVVRAQRGPLRSLTELAGKVRFQK